MSTLLGRWPLMAGIVVLALIAGGIGYASLTSSLFASDASVDLIEACANGQHMRIVDSTTNCKGSEDRISWNEQGVQGHDGPQGLIGLTGADSTVPGPQGPIGLTGATGPVSLYPASMAMDGAGAGFITISNIAVNGRQITGPVAPATSVNVTFDYQVTPVCVSGNCPINQVIVGFAVGNVTCITSGTGNKSGSGNVNLNAPGTVGPAVFAVRMDQQFNCPGGGIGANPASSSYMAVVAVK